MVNPRPSHRKTSVRSTREPWCAVGIRNRKRTTTGWRREQSQMERAFQRLDQVLHLVITEAGRQPQGPGMNHERLGWGFRGSHQPEAKKMVDARLQRSAGIPKLPAQELGDVFVQS